MHAHLASPRALAMNGSTSAAASASAVSDASATDAVVTASKRASSGKKPLPIRLGDITKDNWQQMRRLNLSIFPVEYSDRFYSNTYSPDVKPFSKLAYHNDIVVGAVCCRLEPLVESSSSGNSHASLSSSSAPLPLASASSLPALRVYIMTLGVLAAYRGYGIGSRLLNLVIEYAHTQTNVQELFLHVQTNNTDALQFYERFNFRIVHTITNYYRRINPPDCYVLSRSFNRHTNTT